MPPSAIDPRHLDAFTQAIRLVGMRFTEIAGAHGAEHATLSKQELLAIGMLGLHGRARMGEIAERLGVRQSAVTPIVDRLEAQGIVERQRSEADRRVWLVALTETGAEVYASEDAIYRQAAAEMLAPLTPAERDALIRLLDKMSIADGA